MKNYIIVGIIGLVVGLIMGFFIGRSAQKQISTTFIKLPPVIINPTIPDPETTVGENLVLPSEVTKPNGEIKDLLARIDELNKDELKNKAVIDSLRYVLANTPDLVVDSLAMYRDYTILRSYKNWNMFDIDTIGKFNISMDIQFNRIQKVYDGVFHPVQKIIKHQKRDIWVPFISGSYSTLNYIDIGGGVFYHDLGFEYQYQKSLGHQSNGHRFGLKWKF